MTVPQYNKPIDVTAVTVTTSPTALLGSTSHGVAGRRSGFIVQPSSVIYIGGKSVTKDTGIKLATDQIFMPDANQGDGWYGICETGTVVTRVLPIVNA